MRFLFFKVLGPICLILLARSFLRSIMEGFRSTNRRVNALNLRPQYRRAEKVKRDPVCGTYVAASGAIIRNVKGQPVYFCSPACRDKYRAA